jgi:hypothetical protein
VTDVISAPCGFCKIRRDELRRSKAKIGDPVLSLLEVTDFCAP